MFRNKKGFRNLLTSAFRCLWQSKGVACWYIFAIQVNKKSFFKNWFSKTWNKAKTVVNNIKNTIKKSINKSAEKHYGRNDKNKVTDSVDNIVKNYTKVSEWDDKYHENTRDDTKGWLKWALD